MTHFCLEACRQERCEIIIQAEILGQVGVLLQDIVPRSKHAVVLTDRNVQVLYSSNLEKGLKDTGHKSDVIAISPGERSKSLAVAAEMWEHLVSLGFQRRSILIALGGGVITDLGGFVAATYMRGVPYVNVPTTLLAQVDAAIGGKVAVDHIHAKNLLGSFYHPCAVYSDPNVLKTLPVEETRHGLAEAIKAAIIGSQPLFEFIEQHALALLNGDTSLLTRLITMAVTTKIAFLTPDPYERDLRRGLNFGHMIGHALETALAYKGMPHGEAISIGMATATRIAQARGLCDEQSASRIQALLAGIGLPIATSVTSSQIWHSLSIIRAIRNGHFYEVLPTGIGQYVFSDDLSEIELGHYLSRREL